MITVLLSIAAAIGAFMLVMLAIGGAIGLLVALAVLIFDWIPEQWRKLNRRNKP